MHASALGLSRVSAVASAISACRPWRRSYGARASSWASVAVLYCRAWIRAARGQSVSQSVITGPVSKGGGDVSARAHTCVAFVRWVAFGPSELRNGAQSASGSHERHASPAGVSDAPPRGGYVDLRGSWYMYGASGFNDPTGSPDP